MQDVSSLCGSWDYSDDEVYQRAYWYHLVDRVVPDVSGAIEQMMSVPLVQNEDKYTFSAVLKLNDQRRKSRNSGSGRTVIHQTEDLPGEEAPGTYRNRKGRSGGRDQYRLISWQKSCVMERTSSRATFLTEAEVRFQLRMKIMNRLGFLF